MSSIQSNVQQITSSDNTQQSISEKKEVDSSTGVGSKQQAVTNSETVNAAEVVDEEMSRYSSRSSRLSGGKNLQYLTNFKV